MESAPGRIADTNLVVRTILRDVSEPQIRTLNCRHCTYMRVCVREDFPVEPGELGAGNSVSEALEVGVASRDRKRGAARTVIVLCVVVASTPVG